ncbi:MAG TPA: hypothetical protein VH985_12150 [Candidatus Binatia bacterium]
MKLADSFKVKSSEPAGHYARALRVIGQDLADLFPQQVEIDYQGNRFEVRVRCDRKRAEKRMPQAEKTGLRNIIHKLATYRLDKGPEGTEIATVEQTYETEEINRLDEAGLHRRMQAGKVPDINSLGETLRTIGRMIDADDGRLIRIFKDQRRVAFDYADKSGAMRKVEMTRSELFKLQQTYYDNRGSRQSIDSWRDHD